MTPFAVLNALLYSGMPAIDWMTPIAHLNQNGNPPMGPTVPSGASGYYFFDWEVDYTDAPYLGQSDAVAASALVNTEALSLISAAKVAAPSALIGFYDLPAHSGYAGNAAWQMALQPMVDACDFVAPSLYNADTTPWIPSWISYAAMRLAEMRALTSKPVYPFVWNRYATAPNAPQPIRDWKIQLQWIKENCDGIILWGGYQEVWSAESAWWLAAKSVLGLA